MGYGPDEWVNVVISALDKYVSTQHLIGTQLVEFSSFEVVKNEISSGEAYMTSYLQAWHAWPDNRLRVVMGTYQDTVRYKSGIGWQIDKMHLEHTIVYLSYFSPNLQLIPLDEIYLIVS